MSNIVKLKPKNRLKSPAVSESRLIKACIAYAASMAAYKAALVASPDDAYADKAQESALKRATAALRVATKKATTAGALSAKARILPVIMDDASDGMLSCSFETEQIEFLASFATDVKAYLQPTVDDEWRARCFGEVEGGAS